MGLVADGPCAPAPLEDGIPVADCVGPHDHESRRAVLVSCVDTSFRRRSMTFHRVRLLPKRLRIDFRGLDHEVQAEAKRPEELARALWNQNEERREPRLKRKS